MRISSFRILLIMILSLFPAIGTHLLAQECYNYGIGNGSRIGDIGINCNEFKDNMQVIDGKIILTVGPNMNSGKIGQQYVISSDCSELKALVDEFEGYVKYMVTNGVNEEDTDKQRICLKCWKSMYEYCLTIYSKNDSQKENQNRDGRRSTASETSNESTGVEYSDNNSRSNRSGGNSDDSPLTWSDGSKYLSGTEELDLYYLYVPGGNNGGAPRHNGSYLYFEPATCQGYATYITIVNKTDKKIKFHANIEVGNELGKICNDIITAPISGIVGPKSSTKLRLKDDAWIDVNLKLGKPGYRFTKITLVK